MSDTPSAGSLPTTPLQTGPSSPTSPALHPDSKESNFGAKEMVAAYEKLAGRADAEMGRVFRIYGIAMTCITLLFAVAGTMFVYYFHKSVDELSESIEHRVDEKVSPEQIEKLAKSKVDSITDALIKSKAAEIIDPKFQSIDRRLTDAEENLSFDLQALLATRDSRRDFDGLRQIAADPSNRFRDRAVKIVKSLSENSLTSTIVTSDFKWISVGVDLDNVKLTDITPHYRDLISAADKEVALNEIWSSAKFSIFDKLSFAIDDLLTGDSSLAALRSASGFAEQYAKLKKSIADYPAYMDWWKTHKNEFRNLK